jgi:hypothetical protein
LELAFFRCSENVQPIEIEQRTTSGANATIELRAYGPCNPGKGTGGCCHTKSVLILDLSHNNSIQRLVYYYFYRSTT